MKFLRLKISSNFLNSLNFGDLFKYFNEIELLDFYHYDSHSFFALERLLIKPEYAKNWQEIIKSSHKVKYFDLVRKKGHEIIAIMNVSKESGFFPFIGSDSWAIIPPTTIDEDSIHLNVLAPSDVLQSLYSTITDSGATFEILAINDFKQTIMNGNRLLYPKFTQRQKDIARYAVRHGYFNTPKQISAEEIAKKFNISVSAVNEHLRKARKIALEFFFA